jgi:hypothetical protein
MRFLAWIAQARARQFDRRADLALSRAQRICLMRQGYDRALNILPFGDRSTFQAKLFDWMPPLSAAQTAEIGSATQIIYDSFQFALIAGVPKEKAGILMEQFGAAILRGAAAKGTVTACPTEKNGRDKFDFEYGEDCAPYRGLRPDLLQRAATLHLEGDRTLNQRRARRSRSYNTSSASSHSGSLLLQESCLIRTNDDGVTGVHEFAGDVCDRPAVALPVESEEDPM